MSSFRRSHRIPKAMRNNTLLPSWSTWAGFKPRFSWWETPETLEKIMETLGNHPFWFDDLFHFCVLETSFQVVIVFPRWFKKGKKAQQLSFSLTLRVRWIRKWSPSGWIQYSMRPVSRQGIQKQASELHARHAVARPLWVMSHATCSQLKTCWITLDDPHLDSQTKVVKQIHDVRWKEPIPKNVDILIGSKFAKIRSFQRNPTNGYT